MALREVMQYAIELGFDGRDAERDSKATFDKIEDQAEQSSGRFEGVGGKMGTALIAGFAAIGVGAILLGSVNAAFERIDARNILQGKFDLSAQDAQRFGQLAGDLYSDGFGESVDQLQNIAALANQRLGVAVGDGLSEITKQVAAVSKTWGEDYEAVIRSVSQILDNDLAPSAEDALDLIVAGFQGGANEAGDLLDTIDEYSQHWASMGLSGEEAMNQIVHAIQTGQRDTDRLADAVKEMRIRAVEDSDKISDAYADLGLDADDLRRKFLAGGDDAKEAFLTVINALRDVEDPIEQNRLAIELIGTQYEDLGPKALDALATIDGAIDETTKKAAKLAEVTQETDWERFKREGEVAVAGVGNDIADYLAPALEGGRAILDAFRGDFSHFQEDTTERTLKIRDEWVELGLSIEEANEKVGITGDSFEDLADDTTEAMETIQRSIEDAKAELEDTGTTGSTAARQIEDSIEAAKQEFEQAQERIRRFGADGVEQMDNVSRSVQGTKDAFAELRGEIANRTELRNLEDQFDRVLEAAQDAATGGEQAAREHAQAIDDLRLKTLDFVEQIGEIPEETTTEILAHIDDGSFSVAEARLAALAARREVSYVPVVQPPRVAGGRGYSHTGSRATAGEERVVLSGETFVPDVPGRIDSREDTRRAFATERPTGGDTIVLSFEGANFYGAPPDRWAADLADQIQRIEEGRS